MLIIKIEDNNLTKGLKELKNKFSKTKVVKELQDRKEHTKKSVKLRKVKIKAKHKLKKQNHESRD